MGTKIKSVRVWYQLCYCLCGYRNFFFNYSDRKSYPVPLDKAPLARLENIEMYKIPFLIQVNPIFPGDREINTKWYML